MTKYSEFKKRFKIEVTKPEQSHFAYLTHYLQTQNLPESEYFKESTVDYFVNVKQGGQLEEPLFSEYLPIEWDVPFPSPKTPKFKFIDLFAGIGGFRLAFQNLGGKCMFTSEWNYFAQKTYEANFGEVPFGDITKIDENEIPDHDILIGGFPCQPFSIAGVSKKNSLGRAHGFSDETQGTLFFDIARIIEAKKPKAFLLENVKNLVSHDKRNTFRVISNTLKELGYDIHFQVLDGKYYVPQHRERIVIVGFRHEVFNGQEDFKFPQTSGETGRIKDILEEEVDAKYTLSDKLWNYLQEYSKKHKAKGNGFGYGLVDFENHTRTLSARYYKDGSEILVPQDGFNPRRLTPRECARLQGYPDEFVIPVSDNQAYRQFGNSVVVPLMQAVGERIINVLLDGKHSSDSYKSCSEIAESVL